MNGNKIFESLKNGNVSSIEVLYADYRTSFLAWGRQHFDSNRQDLEDAWQEAVIAFFEQIQSGKLLTPPGNIKTYLFAIGKHKLLNAHRKSKKIELRTSFDIEIEDDYTQIYQQKNDWEQQFLEVNEAIAAVTKKCRDLLIKRYYLKQSIKEIQISENLASPAVVSVSISRCLKGLKQHIHSKNKMRIA
ncbi:MAG: sigma-70 family RNA polymerase sigma factor [Bacteroidota bacterium]|nr:sigma-70 family RNA polymerase sigma factor [Bacteroidota bacterium]